MHVRYSYYYLVIVMTFGKTKKFVVTGDFTLEELYSLKNFAKLLELNMH